MAGRVVEEIVQAVKPVSVVEFGLRGRRRKQLLILVEISVAQIMGSVASPHAQLHFIMGVITS
jgi:hypothetical protein